MICWHILAFDLLLYQAKMLNGVSIVMWCGGECKMMISYLYVYSKPYCFISLYTQNGSTALLVSSLNGHSEVVKLLLQAGARDLTNKVLLQQEHDSSDDKMNALKCRTLGVYNGCAQIRACY